MDYIREHKKTSIIVFILALLILLFGTTFARYIYNVIHNHILESKMGKNIKLITGMVLIPIL